ncbi:hypothetical protein NSK_001771 [Nannochloropsis salina CCMP1776]|uniref:Methyltransferase domain-containing protein n=1 Tax=Nannochloropsis salina CCMP1776 TaxID=1027361 RepID=A0A4D9D538_9STRA|nr:hypothetical protein NSK_001771 [Nannochloropsis salina CCMP1776]|eukprot:TFJ86682.1 hypothetical protein NSK_001771 [Nannochloropsis salina CCMP1776]
MSHQNFNPSSLQLFEHAWQAYRKLVDNDYMEHSALTTAIALILPTLLPSPCPVTGKKEAWMADLGCGDLGLLAPMLRPLPLAGFIGVDATAEVLPLAARRLNARAESLQARPPWPCEWVCADLLEWSEKRRDVMRGISGGVGDAQGRVSFFLSKEEDGRTGHRHVEGKAEGRETVAEEDGCTVRKDAGGGCSGLPLSPVPRYLNVVSSLFALHHLSDSGKQRALTALRACVAPGGSMLVADIFRQDGEERELYLERYEARSREWTALTEEERELITEHVRSSDFPSERSAFERMAKEAGWAGVRWLWEASHAAEALVLLQC